MCLREKPCPFSVYWIGARVRVVVVHVVKDAIGIGIGRGGRWAWGLVVDDDGAVAGVVEDDQVVVVVGGRRFAGFGHL